MSKFSSNVLDSFDTQQGPVEYYSLAKLESAGFSGLTRMPVSIRVLAESVVRSVNGQEVTDEHVERFSGYDTKKPGELEIPFRYISFVPAPSGSTKIWCRSRSGNLTTLSSMEGQ